MQRRRSRSAEAGRGAQTGEIVACGRSADRLSRHALTISPGSPLPLGVHDCCDGINFAIFSRHATRLELLLYADGADMDPAYVVDLDPASHRTGNIWHLLVDGLRWGQAYAFRAHGPWAPAQGHRYDARVPLLDPYALAVAGTDRWHLEERTDPGVPPGSSRPVLQTARCLLVDRRFDWQGIGRPKRPWCETVIYETHLRGFTVHASSGVRHPGTFAGLVEKIGYLKSLGVTAVELMPVQEFCERDNPHRNPLTGQQLRNYWGYNTVAFFAPKETYGTGAAPGCQVAEFKTMVRELHRAGIEVILDVVFNHTAEGDDRGPTLSFRGLDNAVYYLLDGVGRPLDFTGCGNTLNCSHPVVHDFIIDCLRYWVTDMHVDGFRFDLASILGRGENGRLLENPPLLERIAEDPILSDVKLIAEAWDAGGAFQVGHFPGQRWAEWNCHFRDDVRRFWRGDTGMRGRLASRLCGSADLYERGGKAPISSVNFVACHDGFTLNDLVTYAHKNNEANGAENLDGRDDELSANYGVEGKTSEPAIERIRLRQVKNMIATLLVSRGVPMLLGGDEFRRTQRGNSNAYCHDDATSWYDWALVQRNSSLGRFVRKMIEVRRRFSVLRTDAYYCDADVGWFDCGGETPDWSAPHRTLGMAIRGSAGGVPVICLLFNAGEAVAAFNLPVDTAPWRCVFDTGRDDECDAEVRTLPEPLIDQGIYRMTARSMAMLTTG